MSRKRQAVFTKSEMTNLLGVSEKQHEVYMPNEIFNDLTEAFKENELQGKTSTHIAFAYSYYFLANYMWRYARYRHVDDKSGESPINEGLIKQILGFPAKSEQYTYLTKNKSGLLQNLGYIRKETDKPCRYFYENNGKKEVVFVYESDYPEVYGNNKNWKVSMPVKGIWRYEESELDNCEDGTFYMIQKTHKIDIDVFIYCMTDAELGVEGFYLYSFLKYSTDKFKAFDCSNKGMAYLTGMSIDEVKSQLYKLEKRNMIENDHKPFCRNKPNDKQTKANTYRINERYEFISNKFQFNTIPKQRKISAERYEIEIGWANEREINGDIEDYEEMNDLPFD
ncbi:hypothetical protein [Paenibacillus endoradicis]|uniref:hypothetical protein n=1 Tax=Paenibacillus endoradicis TaxID=2972487 RepID=UPI0021590BA8|nr:hypothetical protein [Paenibacillus endoradicis]MCR8659315.1 hypothetical protein [Paenibacillus endoradicis]